ncbi:MAG: hypothetical protein ACRBDI_06885 [Alphaproteobacteria bacterium]
MHIYIAILTIFLVGTFSITAHAYDDGFGDRFYNSSPSALGEYTAEEETSQDIAMDEAAEGLQDIQPAAGTEEPDNEIEDMGQ